MAHCILFLAILVKGEAGDRITQHKEYAAQHFKASRALNSPPHLTLVPPFQWPEEQIAMLSGGLSGFMATQNLPAIHLHNFDCFAPRVIFVAVEDNPALHQFQQALETFCVQQFGVQSDRTHGFHPHVTVAFKDLREKVFPEAWRHYAAQSYDHAFQADGVALLRHNGVIWEVLQEF